MNVNQFNTSTFLGISTANKAPENFSPILYDDSITFKKSLNLGDFISVKDTQKIPHYYELFVEYKDINVIEYGDYIAFPDSDLDWQLYQVKKPVIDISTDELTFTATCTHVLYDLVDDYPVTQGFVGAPFSVAMDTILSNSQFVASYENQDIPDSLITYQITNRTPLEAIYTVCNYKEYEFKPIVVISDSNEVVNLYLHVVERLGVNRGVTLEVGYNADNLSIEYDDSNLVTALVGIGVDEEGNEIDISSVTWSTGSGDPLDKPNGQVWLEDPDATAAYGIIKYDGTGTRQPRFDVYQSLAQTPEALISELYTQLQKRTAPIVNYPVDIKLLENIYPDQKVRLGDNVTLIINELGAKLDVRVISITRDRLHNTSGSCELGNAITIFLDQNSILQRKTVALNENGQIPSSKLYTQINTDMVADEAITVAKLFVEALSAITADLGTINAGTLNGVEIILEGSASNFKFRINDTVDSGYLQSGSRELRVYDSAGTSTVIRLLRLSDTGSLVLFNVGDSTKDISLSSALGQVLSYDFYAENNVSALTFTDRTPFYDGNALEEIKQIKGKDGEIDHSTLPDFARKKVNKYKKVDKFIVEEDKKTGKKVTGVTKDLVVDGTEEGRDLGAMISILTKAVQELTEKVEYLENKIV